MRFYVFTEFSSYLQYSDHFILRILHKLRCNNQLYLSIFNPKDLIIMIKTMANDPQAKVRDLLSRLGIDADGPVAQITDWLQRSKENATPLGQIKNMGGGPPVGSGMPPAEPQMPGRKPMVSPPGAPTAGGMEGLLGKIGR